MPESGCLLQLRNPARPTGAGQGRRGRQLEGVGIDAVEGPKYEAIRPLVHGDRLWTEHGTAAGRQTARQRRPAAGSRSRQNASRRASSGTHGVRRAGTAPREPPSAVPRPRRPPPRRREAGQTHPEPGIPALRSARRASRGHGRCVGVGAALACVGETLRKRGQPGHPFTLVLRGSTIAPPWWSRPPGRLRASGSAFVAACPSSGLATAWKIVFPVVKPGSSSPAWLIAAGIRSAGGLWRRPCGGTIRRPRTTSGCARCCPA